MQLEGAFTRANGSGGPAGNTGDRSAAHLAASVVPLVNKLYKLRLEAMLKVGPTARSIGTGLPPLLSLTIPSSPSSFPPPLPLHPSGYQGHSGPLPLLRLPVQPD